MPGERSSRADYYGVTRGPTPGCRLNSRLFSWPDLTLARQSRQEISPRVSTARIRSWTVKLRSRLCVRRRGRRGSGAGWRPGQGPRGRLRSAISGGMPAPGARRVSQDPAVKVLCPSSSGRAQRKAAGCPSAWGGWAPDARIRATAPSSRCSPLATREVGGCLLTARFLET